MRSLDTKVHLVGQVGDTQAADELLGLDIGVGAREASQEIGGDGNPVRHTADLAPRDGGSRIRFNHVDIAGKRFMDDRAIEVFFRQPILRPVTWRWYLHCLHVLRLSLVRLCTKQ